MACPFFYPLKPFEESRWPGRPHLPLGDPYDGECRAAELPCRPNDYELKSWCNLGYVRGKCPRFREAHEVDAVRFAVRQDKNGIVSITYVLERDHRPFEHGTLDYQPARQVFVTPHPDPNVHRQGQAYAEAYLRRKPAAAAAGAGGPSRR